MGAQTLIFTIKSLPSSLRTIIPFLDGKRSSGWLESWEGLFLVTDIFTTCVEVTSESSDSLVSWKFPCKQFYWSIGSNCWLTGDVVGLEINRCVLRWIINSVTVSCGVIFCKVREEVDNDLVQFNIIVLRW